MTEVLPFSIGRPGFETNQSTEYWRQMRTGEVVIGGFAVGDEGMGIGWYLDARAAGCAAPGHPACSRRSIRSSRMLASPVAGPVCSTSHR